MLDKVEADIFQTIGSLFTQSSSNIPIPLQINKINSLDFGIMDKSCRESSSLRGSQLSPSSAIERKNQSGRLIQINRPGSNKIAGKTGPTLDSVGETKVRFNYDRTQQGEESNVDDDEEDEEEIVVRNLNGIILQYLESCGLTDTYTTFFDECKSSGMLISDSFTAEIEKGISLQDVETLLMHFDQENGEALLELWEVLIGVVDLGQSHKEVEKITFYIQVYIALIPFRQKMSEERKSSSMKKLREYFETKSEACTIDNEMSSLFALPFVPDPETHPIFGNLFKIAWVKKLRSRIKDLARALCSPNKLITMDKTDLAKMFMVCSKAIPHEIQPNGDKKMCIFSNVEPVHFTSGVLVPPTSRLKQELRSGDEFSPSKFFQRMNDLILENERYKKEESKYEKQCAQLLNVALLLANSLEEAAQGKEVNMDKLRHEVNECLPLSMKPNEGGSLLARPKLMSTNASDDSDISDRSLLAYAAEKNTVEKNVSYTNRCKKQC